MPLTLILRKCAGGYQLGNEHHHVNHLLYLDDLKLYGRNQQEIQSLVRTVKLFSDDISMELRFEKCASLSIKRGKVQNQTAPCLEGILPLPEGSFYRYLGMFESNVFATDKMKSVVQQEFLKRCRVVLQTELNSGNKMKGIRMFAVPVIRYSAALLDWTMTELNHLDIRFRKLLSMHGAHHIKSNVDRLYLPRSCGGRGFLSLVDVVECERRSLAEYLCSAEESLLHCARDVLRIKDRGTVDDYLGECRQRRIVHWRNMSLHGEFLKKLDKGGDLSISFQWLERGLLKIVSETQIIAAQDQALAVRAIQSGIYGLSVSSLCRVCHTTSESVDHLLSSCTPLAATMYKRRHDSVARIIHWALSKRFKLDACGSYWNHEPQSVSENSEVKLLWDFNIYTDHVLSARRPDIVLVDKHNNTVEIIDISVPADSNVSSKETEKIEKYRDLSIELTSLWKMTCNVVPIVVGCLGCVTQMLESNLCKLDIINFCKLEVLQRTAVLGSGYILRRYL